MLRAFSSCRGRALVLGRRRLGETPDPDEVELSLAASLGELDAVGQRAPVIVLRLGERDDAAWARPALHWLAARGRRVLLRTAAVMSKPLVEEALAWGSTILLELAAPDPKVHRALLGRRVDPVAALLLHAQHLRGRGLEVAVHVGPLLPTVHDRQEPMESLWQHVAAADIRDAHIAVGRLSSIRLGALQQALPWSQVAAILRAYGIGFAAPDGDITFASNLPRQGVGLDRITAAHMFHAVRRMAEGVGIRIDHCGCPVQCHLDSEVVGDYVDLTTPDLFGNVAG